MSQRRDPIRRTPADLLAFERAFELAGEADFAVDRESLFFEAAWIIVDTVVSSFGWVVVLRDERRVYLEYTPSDTESDVEGEPSEELSIATLAAGPSVARLSHPRRRRPFTRLSTLKCSRRDRSD
jgi:hypothetical protein